MSINLNDFERIASIKVVGIGGAGNNAINHMIEASIGGVEFIAVNTDLQVLSMSKTQNRLVIGRSLTKGLGSGSVPEIGEQAAIENEEEIKESLKGADLVFITAGMGGGTGTGAAHFIARIAKEMGALVVAVVTRPFEFEGKQRSKNAEMGIEKLKNYVDTIIIVSNDKLSKIASGIPIHEAFRETDNVLRIAIQSITDLLVIPALINIDFADVRFVIEKRGAALLGVGKSKGENKAIDAVTKAIESCYLSENVSINGATNAIVNVTVGRNSTLKDAQDAVTYIKEKANNNIDVIFGVVVNENYDDEIIVTIIATGIDNYQEVVANPTESNNNKEYFRNRFGISKNEK